MYDADSEEELPDVAYSSPRVQKHSSKSATGKQKLVDLPPVNMRGLVNLTLRALGCQQVVQDI